MQNQKIIIEPLGGLGNRLRVIASALKYQKDFHCKLICIWNENSELNAPFNKLFDQISGLTFHSKSVKYFWLKSSNQKNPLKRKAAKIINKLAGIDFCIKQQDISDLFWSQKTDIVQLGRNYKNIYIQTCEEFLDNNEEFQEFKPVRELQEKIDKVCREFDDTIGIHIRRTDNIQSVVNSPTGLFIEKMKMETDNNQNVTFFLSTDDPDIERELIQIFGNKIFTRKKILNRNTPEGMQDAVIDMFCLSKTVLIYGSYWASFGEIASRIGKIEFVSVKKDKSL